MTDKTAEAPWSAFAEQPPSANAPEGGVGAGLATVDDVYYAVHMSTTITIRASESLRQALDKKAAAGGKTVSALVREILEEAVAERPLKARVGHLRGRLERSRGSSDEWRKRLRERNWRA